MAIKDGLRTLLSGQASITSLVPAQVMKNGATVNRFFVDKIAQGIIPPYIVISRTRVDPRKTLGTTTGIVESEIDVDCFADTEPLAEAISAAVSSFLKDYTGPAGVLDTIRAVEWDDTNDFQNPEVGQDVWRHAVTLTFTIHHE